MAIEPVKHYTADKDIGHILYQLSLRLTQKGL